MATAQLGAIGRHIRKLVIDQKMGGETDGAQGGGGPFTPVRLKKGPKACTSLTEISGTITVRVSVDAKPGGKTVTVDVPFTLRSVPLQ
jgi:hypothetical protein